MSGVELIVAASAAGAAAGVTSTTSDAIADAYSGLKQLLARRLAGRKGADVLAADETQPGAWSARLGADLGACGADRDAEVLAAAVRLLELTGPAGSPAGKYHVDLQAAQGVQIGDHDTQTNTFS